jgi:hypothetical protein
MFTDQMSSITEDLFNVNLIFTFVWRSCPVSLIQMVEIFLQEVYFATVQLTFKTGGRNLRRKYLYFPLKNFNISSFMPIDCAFSELY